METTVNRVSKAECGFEVLGERCKCQMEISLE